MKIKKFILPVLLMSLGFVSCNNNNPQDSEKTATTQEEGNKQILAAGSSFVFPLFSKMFNVYEQEKGIKVNYQSIGSGGGIKQLQNRIIDFGATDNPLNDEQLAQSPAPILHIPDCIGAVVISYNLPNDPSLKLTPEILVDIFMGKITKWNDKEIQNLNPGSALPNLTISVVHRSDGSGTSFIFTDYLSKVSNEWENKIGRAQTINWPVGLGGKGNAGIAGLIKQIPGAIGYIELAYAVNNKMPVAILKNKSGNFIKPDLVSTAASANVDMPADLRVSITNTDAPDGYPITSFSYILLFEDLSFNIKSEAKAKNVVNLVSWIIQNGQHYNEPLEYAKLPESVTKKALELMKTLTYNKKPLL